MLVLNKITKTRARVMSRLATGTEFDMSVDPNTAIAQLVDPDPTKPASADVGKIHLFSRADSRHCEVVPFCLSITTWTIGCRASLASFISSHFSFHIHQIRVRIKLSADLPSAYFTHCPYIGNL